MKDTCQKTFCATAPHAVTRCPPRLMSPSFPPFTCSTTLLFSSISPKSCAPFQRALPTALPSLVQMLHDACGIMPASEPSPAPAAAVALGCCRKVLEWVRFAWHAPALSLVLLKSFCGESSSCAFQSSEGSRENGCWKGYPRFRSEE
jgi:hypothetical protein